MSHKLADLHARTDDELVAEHDERAAHTVVGTAYFVDELNRRAQEREALAMRELAAQSFKLGRRTYVLAVATEILSVVAIAVAIVAQFVGR